MKKTYCLGSKKLLGDSFFFSKCVREKKKGACTTKKNELKIDEVTVPKESFKYRLISIVLDIRVVKLCNYPHSFIIYKLFNIINS